MSKDKTGYTATQRSIPVKDITLDILIPTRNRPAKLKEVLGTLLIHLTSLKINTFRLTISDNGDFETRPVVKSLIEELSATFPNSLIRYWETPKIFQSAEEHLAWLYGQKYAEFVWFLGDDDIPAKEGIFTLSKLLEQDNLADFYLFNSKLENDYQMVTLSVFPSALENFESNLLEVIKKFGYWSTVCGITNQILRSEFLSQSTLEKIIKECGSIYSHMTHHIIQFQNKKLFYVRTPIAIHHLNALNKGDESDWKRHARKNSRSLYDPWLLSFARQVEFLVDEGFIPENYLEMILDLEVGTSSIPFVVPLSARIAWFAEKYKWDKDLRKKLRVYSFEEEEWLRSFLIKFLPKYTMLWLRCFTSQLPATEPTHYMLDPFQGSWKLNYLGFSIYELSSDQIFAIREEDKAKLPYLCADLSQRCKKHTFLATTTEEVEKSINTSSTGLVPCTCFSYDPIIRKKNSSEFPKLKKILLKVYNGLPRKYQLYLKNLLRK